MSNRTRRVARPRRRRPNFVFGAIIAVVVIAAIVALVATHNSGGGAAAVSEPQTQPAMVTGAALPTYSGTGTDAAVGKTIPTVVGKNFNGTPVTIANDGKPKVILFAAHWCPHCQREIPLLSPDLVSHPLTGVEVVTVSTAVDPTLPNYPPSAWFQRVQWPTPVMADDSNSSVATAFGLPGYPYFVFVNAHNQVVARASGEISLAEFHALAAKVGQ